MADEQKGTPYIELCKNISIVVAVLLSIWQGTSFVSGYFRDVDTLRTSVSRLETRVEKSEERIVFLNEFVVVVKQNLAAMEKVASNVDELERTVLELSFAAKKGQ